MTLNLQRSAAVTLNFDKVQGLRDLEDAVLSLSAYCKGSLPRGGLPGRVVAGITYCTVVGLHRESIGIH